jgi:hypothetical protein
MARGIVKHVHDDIGELIGMVVQRVCIIDGTTSSAAARVVRPCLPAQPPRRRRELAVGMDKTFAMGRRKGEGSAPARERE